MKTQALTIAIAICLLAICPVFAYQHPQKQATLTIWAMSCNGQQNFGHVDTNFGSATTITVPAGTTITIYAHANPGWMFEAFYVDNVQILGHDYSVSIKMCKSITLRVQFNPYPTYVPDPAPDPPSSPDYSPTLRWNTHPTAL